MVEYGRNLQASHQAPHMREMRRRGTRQETQFPEPLQSAELGDGALSSSFGMARLLAWCWTGVRRGRREVAEQDLEAVRM